MPPKTSTAGAKGASRPRRSAANTSLASTSGPTPAKKTAKKAQRPSNLNSSILDASMATTPFNNASKKPAVAKRASKPSASSLDASQSASTSAIAMPPKAGPKKGKGASILARAAALPVTKSIPSSRYQPPMTKDRAPAAPVRKAAPRKMAPAEDSDVSLVDGMSEAESEFDDEEVSAGEASDMSDQGARRPASAQPPTQKRKGWPAERERMRKWRKLSVQERECISSEGGLVWRTAIPLLNSMPKNIRSMVADSLTKALNRIDAKLEAGLVPPLARMPLGTTTRRDLPSSMLSWRLEEEGSLLHSESGSANPALQLGMNAETSELEHMLLPEAEQIIELNKTLESQTRQLQRATSQITDLRKQRRLAKANDSPHYPGNLKAHDLLSVTTQKPLVDAAFSAFYRLHAP